jgi:hypothetical protein
MDQTLVDVAVVVVEDTEAALARYRSDELSKKGA